ncbi:hypothetical protein L6452_43101 [Arctium lappa]|uniref:Uncharacterized protein n=1 Tax=Arctium lappa TaxID=4217 RepID=A0ACB8XKW1_ARCLA|nr:hypothetical protein L6452_43101 [Arctium lappa]
MNSPSSCNHSFIAPSIDHHLLQLIPSSSTPSSAPSIDSISLWIVRVFAFACLYFSSILLPQLSIFLSIYIDEIDVEVDEMIEPEYVDDENDGMYLPYIG